MEKDGRPCGRHSSSQRAWSMAEASPGWQRADSKRATGPAAGARLVRARIRLDACSLNHWQPGLQQSALAQSTCSNAVTLHALQEIMTSYWAAARKLKLNRKGRMENGWAYSAGLRRTGRSRIQFPRLFTLERRGSYLRYRLKAPHRQAFAWKD